MHYPICAACQEPMPCREQVSEQISEKASERMERYAVPGVCPACSEPVTRRQKAHYWAENVVIPGGPPVTIHDRGKCKYLAISYDKAWAETTGGRTRLYCPGALTLTSTGDSCSEGGLCPGPDVTHCSFHQMR